MNVYQSIAQVQKKLAHEGISKARENKSQGYKFRGIDDVYNALAPVLAEHGLCILPRILSREVAERETKNGGVLFYVTVEAEFDFVSAEDGTKHTVKTYGEAMDSGDKATNKAMSAAYKYACMQAFCIPTEGDNDADATTHEVKPRAQPASTEGDPVHGMALTVTAKEKKQSKAGKPYYVITAADTQGEAFEVRVIGPAMKYADQAQIGQPVTVDGKWSSYNGQTYILADVLSGLSDAA
jgi:YHS domain-containing protein